MGETLLILSAILGLALGVLSNIVAAWLQPSVERHKRLILAVFIGVAAMAIALSVSSARSGGNEPPILPNTQVSGELLYFENNRWVLKQLSNSSFNIIPLPQNGVNSIAWSPDGLRILFGWRENPNRKSGLYHFNLEDNTIAPFLSLPDLDLGDAVWSPDRSLVAFTATPNRDVTDPVSEIFTFNPATNEIKRLTSKSEFADYPAWSPDSSKIAYQARPDGGNPRIYVMDRDGSNKVQISQGEGLGEIQPSWSPDGKSIAYRSTRNDTTEIWLLYLETREQEQVSFTPAGRVSSKPNWSPDGKWIAFHSNKETNGDEEGYGDIYITDTARNLLYRVTSAGNTWFLFLAWRPNH